MFANGPGDRGSIPGRVIPKTLKMVLHTSFLNTQYYKVLIKGKLEQSRERGSALLYTSVAFWSPLTTVAYFTYLLYCYFRSDPTERGYRKRMIEIWIEFAGLKTTNQRFADQVRTKGCLVGRVFANGPGGMVSIPSCVVPKTLKIVLDTSLLNTQRYKIRIKGKVEESRERSSALPCTSV